MNQSKAQPTKGECAEKLQDREDEDETSEEEDNLEENVASKIKRLFKQKECIVISSDHAIRRRRNSRDAEMSIRKNDR